MPKNWKLIHIKSKQHDITENSPKLPTCEQIEYGEIAINYGKDIETIAIKNENNEIIKFVPEYRIKEYIDEKIAELTKKLNIDIIENDNIESIDSGEY